MTYGLGPMIDSPQSRPTNGTLLGVPDHELVLQFHGGDFDGHAVRVKSTKCSIGSDPSCTLRLFGDDIRPIHCLILRGTQGTCVRRWAPDTRLNGSSFEDAPLRHGDCIGIGPLDLAVSLESRPDPGADRPSDRPVESSVVSVHLERGVQLNRGRARKLLAQLRDSRRRCQQVEEQLEHGRLDSDATLERLQAEDAQVASQRSECETERQHLEADRCELEESRRSHDAEREAWKQQVRRCEQELKRQAEALGESTRQVKSEEASLAQVRSEVESERQRLEADRCELEERRDDVTDYEGPEQPPAPERDDSRPQPTDEPNQALPQIQGFPQIRDEDDLATRQPSAEPVDASSLIAEQQPSGQAPVSAASIVARLQSAAAEGVDGDHAEPGLSSAVPAASREPDDAPNVSDADECPPEPDAPMRPPDLPSGSTGDESDESDESIEDYMAKLLQRVRGGSAQGDPLKSHQVASHAPAPEITAEPVLPRTNSEAVERINERLEKLTPRRVAPELTSNIAEMRELAKTSAQGLIDEHTGRRWINAALGKGAVATVALFTGILLIAWTPDYEDPIFLSAAAALLITVFWGLQGVFLFRAATRIKRKE